MQWQVEAGAYSGTGLVLFTIYLEGRGRLGLTSATRATRATRSGAA